jgi:hypothetical protein
MLTVCSRWLELVAGLFVARYKKRELLGVNLVICVLDDQVGICMFLPFLVNRRRFLQRLGASGSTVRKSDLSFDHAHCLCRHHACGLVLQNGEGDALDLAVVHLVHALSVGVEDHATSRPPWEIVRVSLLEIVAYFPWSLLKVAVSVQ